MQITVKLYASFRSKLFREAVRAYLPGASVADIARDLGIPLGAIGIVLVNGRHAVLKEVAHEALNDADVVSLMPHMGGG